MRQRTGFAATDDLINKVIRSKCALARLKNRWMTPYNAVTVQTGLITAVSATLDVTLFLAVKVSETCLRLAGN